LKPNRTNNLPRQKFSLAELDLPLVVS